MLLYLKLFMCDGPVIEEALWYFVNTNYCFSLCASLSYCLFIFLRCDIPIVVYNTQ